MAAAVSYRSAYSVTFQVYLGSTRFQGVSEAAVLLRSALVCISSCEITVLRDHSEAARKTNLRGLKLAGLTKQILLIDHSNCNPY